MTVPPTCQHPGDYRTAETRRGTFDYIWQICRACGAERLQNEEGDGWSGWEPAEFGSGWPVAPSPARGTRAWFRNETAKALARAVADGTVPSVARILGAVHDGTWGCPRCGSLAVVTHTPGQPDKYEPACGCADTARELAAAVETNARLLARRGETRPEPYSCPNCQCFFDRPGQQHEPCGQPYSGDCPDCSALDGQPCDATCLRYREDPGE